VAEHGDRVHRDNPEVSHEASDVSVGGILRFAAALLVAGIVIHIALYGLLLYYKQREAGRPPARDFSQGEKAPAPEPALRVAPRADLAEMRGAEDRLLNSYGWIDREKNIVRIPIERSMEAIASQGLPVRKQTPQKNKESVRMEQDRAAGPVK
jgi:hypothetical protein